MILDLLSLLLNNLLSLNLKNNFNFLIVKRICILYLICFYRFFFKIKESFLAKMLKERNFKKNLFFKKKHKTKVLASKRFSFFLKKKNFLKKFFKKKKKDNGNFFFKKFFFKNILKNRNFLKNFYLKKKKIRQIKLTKTLYKISKQINNTRLYECGVNILLLKVGYFYFLNDTNRFIKSVGIYINGVCIKNPSTHLVVGDCIQMRFCQHTYVYLKFCKKFLKKKIKKIKFLSWRFLKKKFFKKVKSKRRRDSSYIYIFLFFRFNLPRFVEIDISMFCIFILNCNKSSKQQTYINKKSFTNSLFSFYNYKKIN